MLLSIKVVQSRSLFDVVSATFGPPDSWANRFLRAHGMASRLTFSSGELVPEDLLCFPDAPNVVLGEAGDPGALQRLAALAPRVSGLIRTNEGLPLMISPFVAVFKAAALSTPYYELPDLVSAWILDEAEPVELTHRILGAVNARQLRRVHLTCGELIVLPDSRTVSYGVNNVRLSPAEFALAELFFSRLGSVISLNELTGFFKAAGKSTEPNNIRVTIHQLRLKLEELTRTRLQLCTIYRKGYCLRQTHRPSAEAGEPLDAELAP
jgi:DNA-binding response OmpR family regulator